MSNRSIARLCVFCGSSRGVRPEYADAARALGRTLAEDGISLVYGGGGTGMMGALADAVLEAGGEAIGVIPHDLDTRELAHRSLTTLHRVNSMHERKAMMAERSDGFVSLPGGTGTFDETFEILTWAQLGLHNKPVGVLNVSGYFNPLIRLLDHAVAEQFLKPEHRRLLIVESNHEPLLKQMRERAASLA